MVCSLTLQAIEPGVQLFYPTLLMLLLLLMFITQERVRAGVNGSSSSTSKVNRSVAKVHGKMYGNLPGRDDERGNVGHLNSVTAGFSVSRCLIQEWGRGEQV